MVFTISGGDPAAPLLVHHFGQCIGNSRCLFGYGLWKRFELEEKRQPLRGKSYKTKQLASLHTCSRKWTHMDHYQGGSAIRPRMRNGRWERAQEAPPAEGNDKWIHYNFWKQIILLTRHIIYLYAI